jgi:Ca-activated chloride channel homolog
MARRINDPLQGPIFLRPCYPSILFVIIFFSIGYGASKAATEPPGGSPDEPRVNIVPRSQPEPNKSKIDNSKSDIRVDVNVVFVPVTVTDPLGTPVLGLHPESFRVLEDGVEQPVAHLVTQDAPLSVGFVFDASKSMESKLDKSKAAIAELMKVSMPGDEYSLISFNDNPKLLSGFTGEPGDIQNALTTIQPAGWTALLDAIHLSVSYMKRAKNTRKALVILSDGGDNNSRFNQHEIRDLLRESDVTLYAIGILGRMVTAGAMKLLASLAEETGGRLFPVHNVNQLPEAVAKLNKALRDQYMLAYYPTNRARDGKFRRVQVRLVPPPSSPSLRASWRSGYYAPPY